MATTVVTVLIAAGGAAFAQASPGQSVDSLRQTDAEALAESIAGRNVDVRDATFTGFDVQAGRFNGLGDTGIRRGVALTTGSVIPAEPEAPDDVDFTRSSILGPNVSLTTTGDLGGEGSPELEALFGTTTYDAAVLTMKVVPRRTRSR
ncbi:choice-of-anchor L domain-containing protein [Oerskovia sp. M15]